MSWIILSWSTNSDQNERGPCPSGVELEPGMIIELRKALNHAGLDTTDAETKLDLIMITTNPPIAQQLKSRRANGSNNGRLANIDGLLSQAIHRE